jgi:nucleotide-binding universal stress UspA family protein
VLLHVSGGPVGTGIETRLRNLRDELQAALRAQSAGSSTGGDATQTALRIDTRVRSGSPAFEIALTGQEEAADFIYFPWKRKNWIQRTLIGSTTRDVIRLSNLPVFVFKQRLVDTSADAFRILYPTAFKETDRYVIPYLEYSGLSADDLILLHVRDRAPDPTAERRQQEWCNRNLERLSTEVRDNYRQVESREGVGNPRKVIPRTARREGISLLVLGKSDQEDALSAMMGSVAEEVANSAPCSVFIVSRAYAPGYTAPAGAAGPSGPSGPSGDEAGSDRTTAGRSS